MAAATVVEAKVAEVVGGEVAGAIEEEMVAEGKEAVRAVAKVVEAMEEGMVEADWVAD
jgi:hypothetical protein